MSQYTDGSIKRTLMAINALLTGQRYVSIEKGLNSSGSTKIIVRDTKD